MSDTREQTLDVTETASAKMHEILQQENASDRGVRIYVEGGGCSGFQYGFTFDEATQDGDTEVVTDGVKLLIDPMSFQYLVGSEVDYKEGLQGSQFVIKNPNATTTCGCGSSFSV